MHMTTWTIGPRNVWKDYRMILTWLLYPSRRSLVKLVPYHSGSCTAGISLCVKLLHSRKGRYISTRRRAPFWQHNCGLSENLGTTDWLPAADDMQLSSEEFLPQKVHPVPQFSHSRKGRRGSSLVFSIEQNLRRAVSEAEWKLPKPVLIRVSVKHLFRSAQAGHDDRGVVTQRAMTLD